MSTTSSSRARRVLLAVAAAVVAPACQSATASGSRVPPEAPLPARPVGAVALPPALDSSSLRRSVELESVSVKAPDEETRELIGAAALQGLSDPLVIDVRTVEPIDPRPRTSWPVLLLNGEKIEATYVAGQPPHRLVGVLPDRSRLRRVNTIEAVWVGNEALTRTRKPLTFTLGDPPPR